MATDSPPAQAPRWRFDHINLHARPDSAATRLFGEVMGLREGHRPPFPFPGQWLYRDGEAWLHLVQAPAEQGDAARLAHIAFRTDESAEVVIGRVRATGLPFEIAVVPEEASVQIFVALPGGLVIEFDTPADAACAPQAYRSRLARAASA